ncbi:uncharacterized protein LOC143578507 [Bidens hawaiensis]|uniref:uncharacterized protein LOC143578507 n=1 Tax=Bidens hawaiensis TaxID=980011 RepID=UPI00404AEF13
MDGSSKKAYSKYRVASAIEVSNFVSVKQLYLRSDYKIWKAQMLCLIESQELLHIIDAEKSFPEDRGVDMISRYDELVKGWITSTLDEDRLKDVKDLVTAREVWMKLESIMTNDTEDGDPAQKQDDIYKKVLRLSIFKYVSVKLSGHNNYHIWKAQMLCLLESQELLHIINAEYPFPGDKGTHMIQPYDKLVKGWIFTTMDHKLLKDFLDYSSVESIWKQLESLFNRPISYTEEGDSWNALDVSALIREDLKYIRVSNVNVSNFVSVTLSGHSNYSIWKAQMMCLLESQELLYVIYIRPNSDNPTSDKYDELVKGWIFGTMKDQLIKNFKGHLWLYFIWKELESMFDPTKLFTKEGTCHEFDYQ